MKLGLLTWYHHNDGSYGRAITSEITFQDIQDYGIMYSYVLLSLSMPSCL